MTWAFCENLPMASDFDAVLRALGTEIRAEADYRKVPLGELATAAGVDRTTIYKYLNDRRAMPLPVLLAVAGRLGVSPSVLLDRAEQRARSDSQGR